MTDLPHTQPASGHAASVAWTRALQAGALTALVWGCGIPAVQYDQAVAQTAQERAGRDEAERALADTKQRLSELERRLEAAEQARSQAEYTLAVANRERDDAQQIVEQLRGELDRIARDLRGFGEQNRALATLVADLERRAARLAEVEAEADERAQLLRDLGIALRDDVAGPAVTLTLERGAPVVHLSVEGCFTSGDQLTPDATRVVQQVALLVVPLPSRTVEVTAAPTGEPMATQSAKVTIVANELSRAGMPAARVTTPAAEPGALPGWVMVTIRRVPSR